MDENKLGSHWDEDDFIKEADRLWEAELASDTLPNDNRQKFPCVRCGGSGTYHGVRLHQKESKCFTCKGKGYFLTSQHDRDKAKKRREIKTAEKQAVKAKEIKKKFNKFVDEHKALFDFLVANSGWSDFAESLAQSATKWGGLTDGQLASAYKMKKSCEKGKKADAVIDLSPIRDRLTTAKGNGLKKPKLRCGDNFSFSFAPDKGKNPNFLYVKKNGDYVGKISPKGEWFGLNIQDRYRPSKEANTKAMIEIAKNPLDATIKYGQLTGQCGCCGRLLTNHKSIERGIGPICAENFGF